MPIVQLILGHYTSCHHIPKHRLQTSRQHPPLTVPLNVPRIEGGGWRLHVHSPYQLQWSRDITVPTPALLVTCTQEPVIEVNVGIVKLPEFVRTSVAVDRCKKAPGNPSHPADIGEPSRPVR